MGKIIRIGEGSYKGIADKSIDAGKFTDGAFEELTNAILPEKVDEAIERKVEEKSKEIDDTLRGLRDDLDNEMSSNVDAFTKVQSQIEHMALDMVSSEDVDSIKVVTKRVYEEMFKNNTLDSRTLYHILE